jgi:hypothetical protein
MGKETPTQELLILPETTRDQDKLQYFYKDVMDFFSCSNNRQSPLYLRRGEHGIAMRVNNVWRLYRRGDQIAFWRDAMRSYKELAESNWSTKRTNELWAYFQIYAPEIKFDERRYFEMGNCVLDCLLGKLNYDEDRFLTHPTTRSSELDYEPEYEPTAPWQTWYSEMDVHQKKVRDWSVGSAILGEHGLLFTFGQSRTGKSTLAEGLAEVLGSGAQAISLSRNWGRFYTQHFENTTYLYDSDAKGSKNQNNDNYGELHLMASGDPLQVEIKGGDIYQTTNYGFIEVISNSPAAMSFEQSMVDRVRFCLYTYIESKADGGAMKKMILADKQAWLNYAVNCAIGLAKGDIKRPMIDKYQMYGWVLWLKEANSYGKICVEQGRIVHYSDYENRYQSLPHGKSRFMLTKETVDEMQVGLRELDRQYGKSFLAENWIEYGEEIKKQYYAPKETAKLF